LQKTRSAFLSTESRSSGGTPLAPVMRVKTSTGTRVDQPRATSSFGTSPGAASASSSHWA
jgi:hypothetical protein